MEELLNSITDSNQDKFHLEEKGDQNTEESIVRREVASLIRQTVEDYHSTKDVIDQLLDRLQFEEVKEKYFQELDEDYILIIQNNKQGRKTPIAENFDQSDQDIFVVSDLEDEADEVDEAPVYKSLLESTDSKIPDLSSFSKEFEKKHLDNSFLIGNQLCCTGVDSKGKETKRRPKGPQTQRRPPKEQKIHQRVNKPINSQNKESTSKSPETLNQVKTNKFVQQQQQQQQQLPKKRQIVKEETNFALTEVNQLSEEFDLKKFEVQEEANTCISEDFIEFIPEDFITDILTQEVEKPRKEVSSMSLPRELMLIIDDIADQKRHLLEWEVFGNASEDMRVVLTWRKLDKNQPGGTSQRWKLRKSSVEGLDENGNEEDINGTSSSFGGTGGKDRGGRGAWDSKQKGGKRQAYDEGQYKVGGRRASGVSNASEDESSSLLKRDYQHQYCLLYTSPSPRDRG